MAAGYTAINDGRGTTDCNGHGTHVAGTVGGTTYGVAKQVTIRPVRVLDCNGSGTTSGVIAGVDWVTSNHAAGAPAVANMSLGGGVSSALDTAVNNSIADGVTYAVAAGNENTNACNGSPSRVGAALTVGSTTNTDARSSFSNYGSCLDIFAPGSNITSAWHTGTSATNTISGTSMATPHVAGVAALYLQGNPSASPATVGNAITSTATTGVVSGAQTGSPNRLLYSPAHRWWHHAAADRQPAGQPGLRVRCDLVERHQRRRHQRQRGTGQDRLVEGVAQRLRPDHDRHAVPERHHPVRLERHAVVLALRQQRRDHDVDGLRPADRAGRLRRLHHDAGHVLQPQQGFELRPAQLQHVLLRRPDRDPAVHRHRGLQPGDQLRHRRHLAHDWLDPR